MITTEQIQNLIDSKATVVSNDGDKIGTVGQVFVDDVTGEPTWVTAKTGLFGTSESFVPLSAATVEGDTVRVPYDKSMVKDAPRIDTDQHLSEAEEDELYRYYHLDDSGYSRTDVDTTTTMSGTAGTSGLRDRDRLDTDRGDDASVVLSEEQVNVGTRRREAGRARLRKYVITENVTKTVPVTREEVRIEREPITDGDRHSTTIGDDEAEVTLHEDEVVVDKDTVPVEKVRLNKDTVTEQREVTEQVRKEEVDTDTDRDTGRHTRP
ncbi:DUF2382 domain-containing protein [Georgenia sp. SYP-B2076]|uniref:DUF2382 domain-containing protein n=1 Tax=Georgenia sp. SYP-B2076 TaxID=2495881 RepID=UPI000F8F69BB|nr:PRC and DUF2382 domain-containing protein [Georgenia sp. SYP-B2076]